jgi:hypothetical protein
LFLIRGSHEMAFDYTSLETGTVQRLIVEFGTEGVIMIPGESIGEPYESKLDNDTEIPVKLVRTSFKRADNNGTLVEENDQMFLVSTEGVSCSNDPKLADRLFVDDVELQVVRVDPLRPGPVTMLWKVHVRK